ncbi:unnamed protein product [Haemonchus placei]|uniref:DDE_Tnp_1_7 domain-containing protein n=1 Tax=Haemonchus placei TaxID=6290 RepID=A0A0N4W2B8_HAEPC|nr:unnamed protein product [Haemonchus placei]
MDDDELIQSFNDFLTDSDEESEESAVDYGVVLFVNDGVEESDDDAPELCQKESGVR